MLRVTLASLLVLLVAAAATAQEATVTRGPTTTVIKLHDYSAEARERRSQIAQRTRAKIEARRVSREARQEQARAEQYRYHESFPEARPQPPAQYFVRSRQVDPVWGPYPRPEPLWATPSFPPFGSPIFGPGFATFGPGWGPGFGPGFGPVFAPGPGFIGPGGRCAPGGGRW